MALWRTGDEHPAARRTFRTAINESLAYAQANPTEIRALLPAATQNIAPADLEPARRPRKLVQLAKYTKEFGVIDAAELTRLVPSAVTSGKVLQATVGNFATLRLDGKPVTRCRR